MTGPCEPPDRVITPDLSALAQGQLVEMWIMIAAVIAAREAAVSHRMCIEAELLEDDCEQCLIIRVVPPPEQPTDSGQLGSILPASTPSLQPGGSEGER